VDSLGGESHQPSAKWRSGWGLAKNTLSIDTSGGKGRGQRGRRLDLYQTHGKTGVELKDLFGEVVILLVSALARNS
jgi:hypothetical protein